MSIKSGCARLIERDLILAPVVESSGAGAFVICHLLGDFKFSAIAKVLGDGDRPEGVATDAGLHIGIQGTPPDHPVDIRLAHVFGGQRAGASRGRCKLRDSPIRGSLRAPDGYQGLCAVAEDTRGQSKKRSWPAILSPKQRCQPSCLCGRMPFEQCQTRCCAVRFSALATCAMSSRCAPCWLLSKVSRCA